MIARPGGIALATAAALIALGVPFASIKFLPANASELPTNASAYRVDAALHSEFPPGRTAPLEVVVGAPASSRQVTALAARLRSLPDVSAVAPAQPAGRRLSLIDVAPSTPTYSAASRQLVHHVRSLRTPFYLGVAGDTAGYADLEHSLDTHLPLVLALIIASTLVVLFLMTGSLVLGVKAVLMNALSLSAVFGILVLIFQHGSPQGLLSYRSTGALDATQVFAIAFGLATDYGVFLISRIKEAHDSGMSDNRAVAIGIERTGRIVTAAALLFSVAIGAFVTSKLIFIKELGLRHRARSAHRRIRDPRPARALADGSARQVELVGTGPAAATARPARATRRRTRQRRHRTGCVPGRRPAVKGETSRGWLRRCLPSPVWPAPTAG